MNDAHFIGCPTEDIYYISLVREQPMICLYDVERHFYLSSVVNNDASNLRHASDSLDEMDNQDKYQRQQQQQIYGFSDRK